jgi:ribosomal protein S18 acetylase RimI-like enzyme
MRDIVIKTRKEAGISDEALFELVNESYRQWIDQGLEAHWLHRTLEDFRKMIHHAAIFVAQDAEKGELLGMHCFRGNKKSGRAFGFYLAISPKAKREGFASRMLAYETERIRQSGYRYIKEATATTADWSVRWHLKNGYRIIGYYHSPNDNFANYVFRKQLIPISFSSSSGIAYILRHPVYALYSNATFCRLRYYLAYSITHLTKDSHGQDNLLGRMVRRILKK